MPDRPKMNCIAAATAECGMQSIANWLPASRHNELRELLYDLVFTSLVAYEQMRPVDFPKPSIN